MSDSSLIQRYLVVVVVDRSLGLYYEYRIYYNTDIVEFLIHLESWGNSLISSSSEFSTGRNYTTAPSSLQSFTLQTATCSFLLFHSTGSGRRT